LTYSKFENYDNTKEITMNFTMPNEAGRYHFKFFQSKEYTNPKRSGFIICGPRVEINLDWSGNSNFFKVSWNKIYGDSISGSWIGLYLSEFDLNTDYVDYINVKKG
jgi:hypothetical protein